MKQNLPSFPFLLPFLPPSLLPSLTNKEIKAAYSQSDKHLFLETPSVKYEVIKCED